MKSYSGKMTTKLAAVLLCGLVCASCGREEAPRPQVARPIKTFIFGTATDAGTVEFPGKISASREADMAFDVKGKLVEIPVVEGQQVGEGELLARLDGRDYQSALDAETAQFVSAEAEYKRAQKLFDDGTVSRRDFDLARSAFEVAEAKVKSARKALDETRLLAPFDGRVARIMVNNFESIDAKKTVILMQDSRKLKIKINVPEKDFVLKDINSMDADKITAAAHPRVVLSSLPERAIPARVYEAAMAADPVTRTFEVALVFDSPPDVTILPGMTARVVADALAVKRGSGPMVPVQAVFGSDSGRASVWVLGGDMKVSRRQVVCGDVAGGSISISGGLEVGEEVAVSGVQFLRDGMTVRRFAGQRS